MGVVLGQLSANIVMYIILYTLILIRNYYYFKEPTLTLIYSICFCQSTFSPVFQASIQSKFHSEDYFCFHWCKYAGNKSYQFIWKQLFSLLFLRMLSKVIEFKVSSYFLSVCWRYGIIIIFYSVFLLRKHLSYPYFEGNKSFFLPITRDIFVFLTVILCMILSVFFQLGIRSISLTCSMIRWIIFGKFSTITSNITFTPYCLSFPLRRPLKSMLRLFTAFHVSHFPPYFPLFKF